MAGFFYYWKTSGSFKPYSYQLPAQAGTFPPVNATTTPPPLANSGYWPCWNGSAWYLVEDHRKENGYVNGQPFVIETVGPYPAGWSASPPPPTAAELRTQEKFTILAQLSQIDSQSVRPLRAIANGGAVQADHNKLASLEVQAGPLRTRLAEIIAEEAQ
jgi:hypothetical protein